MKMCIITAHAGSESLTQALLSWGHLVPVRVIDGKEGMIRAYQTGFFVTDDYPGILTYGDSSADILAYLHDDTIISDPEWAYRVMKEFENPKVGLVGFGGATRHGDPRMYRKEYEYSLLARAGFASNMRDAENHGQRFTGEKDVAVLDGFALIVRRKVLEEAGGWPLKTPVGYVCYDYWLCCMARRLGYRIRLVGIACDHLGGQTFVKLGMGRDEKHWKQYIDSHRYIYDEFRDVLPYEVPR